MDVTMDPNVFLVGRWTANNVHLCTVSPNCQSINCDSTGFAIGTGSSTLIISQATNYVLSERYDQDTNKRGYLAQLMVIEVVNLLDAEMERVTASYALIDCIIQA